MAQEKESKKVIEINWFSLMLIFIFMAGSIFFGVRSSRLSEKDQQNIAQQAVLLAQKDSIEKQVVVYQERIKILEAEVNSANSNTSQAEKSALQYKRKYLELKEATPPSPCDTFVVLRECDKQLQVYENFIAILKANVLSYSKLSDTLRIENKYLYQQKSIANDLIGFQKKELTTTRNKLRRSKILNWGLAGLATGAIVVLVAK